MFDVTAWTNALKAHLTPHADKDLAGPMAAYMKNHFPFMGIKAPHRKVLFQEFCKHTSLPSIDHLTEVVKALYDLPEREYQMVAVLLVKKMRRQLSPAHQDLLWMMITEKSWWDTVDDIASNLVGYVLQRSPEYIQDWNSEMIHSDNLWLRRTALLFQLKYKDQLDENLLFQNIRQTAHETDFFIRKAIGWALRQHSKQAPDHVRRFMTTVDLSPLSVREGSKYL
ncbi:MAG: DNA alkylation repair protein [Bacteroidota bacterium]